MNIIFGNYYGPDIITLTQKEADEVIDWTMSVERYNREHNVKDRPCSELSTENRILINGAEWATHQMMGTQHKMPLGDLDAPDACLFWGEHPIPVDSKCKRPGSTSPNHYINWSYRKQNDPPNMIYACFSHIENKTYRFHGWIQKWLLDQNEFTHLERSKVKGHYPRMRVDPKIELRRDNLHMRTH